MARYEDETIRAWLQREFPHHVALPAEALRRGRSETVYAFLVALSAAPQPYHLTRGDADFVVFCFAKADDAQAFAKRFGGELLNHP